jgi:ABC-2 type transport system permease protein
MRWRPYLHLMRTSFLRLMAYRMRYVTGIATYAVFVGVHYFVWSAVWKDQGLAADDRLGGLSLPELTTYLAVGYTARAAYYTNTDSEIAQRFQSGEVVMDLIRPLHFHGNWMAQATGEIAFRLCFFALPMFVVMWFAFGVQGPGLVGAGQFALLFLLAAWVNIELGLLTGTITFWLEDITGLMSLKRNLVMIGSGLMVPLHYLEALVGTVGVALLVASPLAIIGYYPTMAWVGRLGVDGVLPFEQVLALACGWGALLRVANTWLWSSAARRLEVQGG